MVIESQLDGLTKQPKNDLRRQGKKTGLGFFIVVIIYKGGAGVRVPPHSRGHMVGISYQHQRKEFGPSNQLAQFQDVRGRGKGEVGNCQQTSKNGVWFSLSVVSSSLRPHGLQHVRPPCPSPTPGACSDSCP